MVDILNEQFSSAFRYERIAFKGNSGTLVYPNPNPPSGFGSGVQIFIFNHNLGYVPFSRVFLYSIPDNQYYEVVGGGPISYGSPGFQVPDYHLDNTTLTVEVDNLSISGNCIVYYRIYAEPQQ